MTETISFWTEGESFTRLIRNLWDSNLVHVAIEICTDGGMTLEDGVALCTGKLKFEGDTREGDHTLSVVKDNSKTEFIIERQLEILERNFKEFIDCNVMINRKIKFGEMPCGRSAAYRTGGEYTRDSSTLKSNTENLKKIVSSLNVLYPLVGKTIADLPFFDIGGIYLTDPEIWFVDDTYRKIESNREFREQQRKEKQVIVKKEEKEHIPTIPKKHKIDGSEWNGWIDRCGYIYECGYQGHINLSYDMRYHSIIPKDVGNPEKYLENQGWLKISSGRFSFWNYKDISYKLTKQQKDVMMVIWSTHEAFTKRNFKYNFNVRLFESIDEALESIEEDEY